MSAKEIRPAANGPDQKIGATETSTLSSAWRRCRQCGLPTPSESMAPNGGRLANLCKRCRSEYDRRRYLNNREKFEASRWAFGHSRRARKHGLDLVTEVLTRSTIAGHWGNHCFHCRTAGFEQIDHLTPVAAGGHHVLENVVPCCRACNSRKYWESDRAAIQRFRAERIANAGTSSVQSGGGT